MKLIQRQYDVLQYLIEYRDYYISTEQLSVLFKVSIRTIKNDIVVLKSALSAYSSFSLLSKSGKGLKIHVNDQNQFFKDVILLSKNEDIMSISDDNSRNMRILKLLIQKKHNISKEYIMSLFHISESTFYKSYNSIREIVSEFNLELKHSKSNGYYILGRELDKRSLIMRYELFLDGHSLFNHGAEYVNLTNIYNYIAETFISYQYNVTESILQNISFHVFLMTQRIISGNYVDEIRQYSHTQKIEYKIAQSIINKFSVKYLYEESYRENEVNLLTQIILGKVNYSGDEHLQNEINLFISNSFISINRKFGINFESVGKLRLFLALHIAPLIYRISSGTQLLNLMKNEIKQQFPHAYDISLYFTLLFHEHFGQLISLDEATYLTLYFNFGIEEMNLFKSSKRILVITNLRYSETVLLKHKFLTWFPKQISDIDFINTKDTVKNIINYDAIFTTEVNLNSRLQDLATLINVFPNETDYQRINLALNGFTDQTIILDRFSPECFYYGKAKNKEEIINILCNNAIDRFSLDPSFYDKIIDRETISSTYFGDLVAIPHPLMPITTETFASVGVLEYPIKWDNSHEVQIVILLSIERNNPRAFQFWEYIARVIKDEISVNQLLKTKNYSEFINEVSILLTNYK